MKGLRVAYAGVLRKVRQPLGFQEEALLVYADYLSPSAASEGSSQTRDILGGLGLYVAKVLSEEPVEIQRSVIGILTILKSIARAEE